jgi:hypothetical protein
MEVPQDEQEQQQVHGFQHSNTLVKTPLWRGCLSDTERNQCNSAGVLRRLVVSLVGGDARDVYPTTYLFPQTIKTECLEL